MAQYLPYRTSFASLEDDGFFSACSSQPTSRLMSVFTSQEYGQLAEDANSTTRPSEPLVSVYLPVSKSMLPCPREESPVLECLADSHGPAPKNHHFNPTSYRRQSNQSSDQKPPAKTDPADESYLPHFNWVELGHVSQQEIDNIIRNVRGYLSARQHRNSHRELPMLAVTNNSMPTSPSQTPLESSHLDAQTSALREDQYLITTDDIFGIINIIITCVRNFPDDSIQSDYRSLSFPNSTHVKPTLNSQSIIPGASTVVDPATTFCLPRPYFSWADSLEVFGHPSPTAVTTYGMIKKDLLSFLRNLRVPSPPRPLGFKWNPYYM